MADQEQETTLLKGETASTGAEDALDGMYNTAQPLPSSQIDRKVDSTKQSQRDSESADEQESETEGSDSQRGTSELDEWSSEGDFAQYEQQLGESLSDFEQKMEPYKQEAEQQRGEQEGQKIQERQQNASEQGEQNGQSSESEQNGSDRTTPADAEKWQQTQSTEKSSTVAGVSKRDNSKRQTKTDTFVIPADIGKIEREDIVARQLREAAMIEVDPVLREKLWREYRNYMNIEAVDLEQ